MIIIYGIYRLALDEGGESGKIYSVINGTFVSRVSLMSDRKDVVFSNIERLPCEASQEFRHAILLQAEMKDGDEVSFIKGLL